MNPLLLAAGIILIVLPACIAWAVVIRALYHLHRNNQKKKAMTEAYREAHDQWTRHLNDELLAKQVARTPYRRKVELRAVAGGKPIHLTQGKWDGPSAA